MTTLTRLASLAATTAIATITAAPLWAETPLRSTIESRLLLGFKADDAAAAAFLPEGWTPLTLPQGPLAGANLLIAFMDRHLILDAEGKPDDPRANRTVALLSYGVNPEVKGPRAFITRVYETPPLVDPYGNSVPADITREQSSMGSGATPGSRSDAWRIETSSGTLEIALSYTAGPTIWSEGQESRPYSSVRPEYFEIYRYDQLVQIAGAPQIEVSATMPELTGLLGENPEPVAILPLPVFIRDVFLP